MSRYFFWLKLFLWRYLAFNTYRYSGWKLGLLHTKYLPDGQKSSKVQRLSPNKAGNIYEYNAKWSPDSKKIVLEQYYWSNNAHKICVRNVDQSNEVVFDTQIRVVHTPSWSPDGKHVMFTGVKNGQKNYQIFVLDITQKNPQPKQITTHPAANIAPSWSPDGKQIAFHSVGSYVELFIINIDGTGLKNLTNNAQKGIDKFIGGDWQNSEAWKYKTSWSPDGKRIAFTSRRNGNHDIYTIKTDGTHLLRVTSHPSDDFDPFWVK